MKTGQRPQQTNEGKMDDVQGIGHRILQKKTDYYPSTDYAYDSKGNSKVVQASEGDRDFPRPY